MKKVIIILGTFLLFRMYFIKISAESTTNIHLIYSDLEVEKDEEFILTINFEKVKLYNSIQIVLDLGSYFEIVKDEPCELLINSYYMSDEVYVNSIDDNVIRFVAFKKSNNFTSYNNIVQITLKSNISCSDVSTYLGNIKIGLFNEFYETIPINLITSEGIKVEWLIDSYEIELGNGLPDFLSDINVINRESSEYLIKTMTDSININKVGSQVMTIYVYDYTNASSFVLSKAVNIVDKISPVIKGKDEIIVNDYDISEDIINQFEITDNYDETPNVFIKYYDSQDHEIESLDLFINYLKSNLNGKIIVTAVDSSNNQSNEFTQNIKIIDNNPPIVNINNYIEINDYELNDFDLYDYISVEDSYDKNPVIRYYINDAIYPNIIEELNKYYEINVMLNVVDSSLNKTDDFIVKIRLIDTTNPILVKLDDLIIEDHEYSELTEMVNSKIKSSDNFNLPLEYEYCYYYQDNIVSKDDFIKMLYCGEKLKLTVKAFDKYLNYSNEVKLDVQILDTTSPIVTINNVENGKKYLTIPNIDYVVKDNFDTLMNIEIYLDDKPYSNQTINIIGKHSIKIIATDGSGNQTVETINFEIIKNNLIGCGLDSNCYTDNYQTVIYSAFIILVIAVIIFLVKIIIKKNKTKVN